MFVLDTDKIMKRPECFRKRTTFAGVLKFAFRFIMSIDGDRIARFIKKTVF